MPKDVKCKLTSGKAIYLRHIARKRGHNGIGSKLINTFIYAARERGFDCVVCEILEKAPKNAVSANFFSKCGFERVGSIEYEDGLMWGLHMLKL